MLQHVKQLQRKVAFWFGGSLRRYRWWHSVLWKSEMFDNLTDLFWSKDKSYNFHLSSALITYQRIDLIDALYQRGPG